MGAYACEPVSQRETRSHMRPHPVDTGLSEGQPAQLDVQPDVQPAGCAASCKINRAANPTAWRQPAAAKKALSEGGRGPQRSIDFFVFLYSFFVFLIEGGLGKRA